jgi:hypothetical protein
MSKYYIGQRTDVFALRQTQLAFILLQNFCQIGFLPRSHSKEIGIVSGTQLVTSNGGTKHNHSYTDGKFLGLGAENFKISFAFKPISGIARSSFIQDETNMQVDLSMDLFFNVDGTALLDLIDQLFGSQWIIFLEFDPQVGRMHINRDHFLGGGTQEPFGQILESKKSLATSAWTKDKTEW